MALILVSIVAQMGSDSLTVESMNSSVLVILTVACCIAASTIWLTSQFAKINRRLDEMHRTLWTKSEMRSWVQQFRENNPTLSIPSVSDAGDHA